jgi:hypothetical protein
MLVSGGGLWRALAGDLGVEWTASVENESAEFQRNPQHARADKGRGGGSVRTREPGISLCRH